MDMSGAHPPKPTGSPGLTVFGRFFPKKRDTVGERFADQASVNIVTVIRLSGNPFFVMSPQAT